MKTILNILLLIAVTALAGCGGQQNSRIHVREGVGSDTLAGNIVTRPIVHAFSALTGEGIEVTEAVLTRNDAGFLELYVNGYNRSYKIKKFRYKVEWLDEKGLLIQARTSVWLPFSAMGKSPFTIKAVAPTAQAANFRMDTQKWE